MATALETQIKSEVGVEVHLLNRLQRVLHVKGPRATFMHDSRGKKNNNFQFSFKKMLLLYQITL